MDLLHKSKHRKLRLQAMQDEESYVTANKSMMRQRNIRRFLRATNKPLVIPKSTTSAGISPPQSTLNTTEEDDAKLTPTLRKALGRGTEVVNVILLLYCKTELMC